MRNVRFVRINNPLLILVFLPIILFVLILMGVFMLGAAAFGRKRIPTASPRPEQVGDPRPAAPGATIEADFHRVQ